MVQLTWFNQHGSYGSTPFTKHNTVFMQIYHTKNIQDIETQRVVLWSTDSFRNASSWTALIIRNINIIQLIIANVLYLRYQLKSPPDRYLSGFVPFIPAALSVSKAWLGLGWPTKTLILIFSPNLLHWTASRWWIYNLFHWTASRWCIFN